MPKRRKPRKRRKRSVKTTPIVRAALSLTEEEQVELATALKKWERDDALTRLQGFFCALAMTERTVMPTEWLPKVLKPRWFERPSVYAHKMNLLLKVYNHAQDGMLAQPQAMVPAFSTGKQPKWFEGCLDGFAYDAEFFDAVEDFFHIIDSMALAAEQLSWEESSGDEGSSSREEYLEKFGEMLPGLLQRFMVDFHGHRMNPPRRSA